MPQGRRKIPFSGKAKKEQMRAKKQTKACEREQAQEQGKKRNFLSRPCDLDEEQAHSVEKINAQPKGKLSVIQRENNSKYALQFFQETKEELMEKKMQAQNELIRVPETELEMSVEDYFTPELDFPVRPPWDSNMSRDLLDARENRYFREYVSKLEKNFSSKKELSLFELNIETWRQLWRVLEMSDIVLIIIDIRFPVLMFPPSLYKYVIDVLKKNMILVLNKVDLAPAPLVVAWKEYFHEMYPSLNIVIFTSFPGYNILGQTENKSGLQTRRRKGRLRMCAEGAQKLLDACKDIVKNEVDLTSWQNKIKEEMEIETEYEEDDLVIENKEVVKVDTTYEEHERYLNGVLTIGCLGQPNVGKSSLMNAIMGKKVVSVSRTPGHTKHFQTIFLTPTVRLCDCPGLVFPSKVPKALQVIMGSYPIAQLREPFSVVRYIAERIDLVYLLGLSHPEGDTTWSALDVCEGLALKRGFRTARAARLDSYRAANSILRMTLDGKITLCLRPPGFTKNKKFWAEHADVPMVKWIQARLQAFEAENAYSKSDESADEQEQDRSEDGSDKNAETSSDSDENDDSDNETGIVAGKGNMFSALVE